MNKNLFRYQGYIGGVCEGLSIWSGMPSILWRISFVFLSLLPFGFTLFFGYFLKKKFKKIGFKLLYCN